MKKKMNKTKIQFLQRVDETKRIVFTSLEFGFDILFF